MCPWIPAKGFLYWTAIWIHRGPGSSEPYVIFIYYYCAKIGMAYVFISLLPFIRKLFFFSVHKVLNIALILSLFPCIDPISLQTLICSMYWRWQNTINNHLGQYEYCEKLESSTLLKSKFSLTFFFNSLSYNLAGQGLPINISLLIFLCNSDLETYILEVAFKAGSSPSLPTEFRGGWVKPVIISHSKLLGHVSYNWDIQ